LKNGVLAMSSVYDFEAQMSDSKTKKLSDYRGKVLLVVNTASRCRFTPQLSDLEKLYRQYQHQGLEILGFPCNQFGHQDPGNDNEIQKFCQINYGVSFLILAKVDVNGSTSHPLYQHLKQAAPGLLGSKNIKWNFTKFLVGKEGKVLQRFAPATRPAQLTTAIESALLKQ